MSIENRSEISSSNPKPFDYILKGNLAQISRILQHEMPQTIAVILTFLEADKAAALLENFQDEIQVEIIRRISATNLIESDVISEIDNILREKFLLMTENGSMISTGGIESAVSIINLISRQTEKKIINKLEGTEPELANKIKERMFVFEDIVMLDDRAIQKVLRNIDSLDLTKALKSVDSEIQDKIFRNMSKRAASLLKEDMEYMGPVRIKDVEAAQLKIISVCRHLEDTGEIIVARAGEEELVVLGDVSDKLYGPRQSMPYDTMGHLIEFSKKEIFEKLDSNTLAVSLFGVSKYKQKEIFKKLKFGRKIAIKRIIRNLKEIWRDDVIDAQVSITNILQEHFNEKDMPEAEILKD